MVVVVVLAIAAGVLALIGPWSTSDDSDDSPADAQASDPELADIVEVARAAGVGNPRRPELPDVDDAEPTAAYLEDDGVVLLDLQQAVLPLIDRVPPSNDQCRAAAEALDKLGSPTDVYASGEAIPDPVLAELFVSLSASTGRFLGVCDAGDDERRGEVAFQWVLVQRRLDQLGVTT